MGKDKIIVTNLDELQKLKSGISDSEVLLVFDIIQMNYHNILHFIQKSQPNGFSSGMCLEVSRYFNKILQSNGLHPKVLQGEIEIDNNSWLEHHISILCLNSFWMTIDFTANQVNSLTRTNFVIILCKPNKQSLKKALSTIYKWWWAQ